MCGIAEATLAATVIAGVTTAYAQKQQGDARAAEAQYQEAVQRDNMARADYLATDAIERGKQQSSQERLRGRLLQSQMRVVLAGLGQDPNSASAAGLQIDQAKSTELDAQTIENNAEREAEGFRIKASQFGASADLYQIGGQNAKTNASYQAAGTLLTSAAKVSDKWYQYDKAGAFD